MLCNLLSVSTNFQVDTAKHSEKKSAKLFRGRDLNLMELKPHVSLAGSSTNSPFWVFLSTRGPKISQAWQKSVAIKTLTIWVCVLHIQHSILLATPIPETNKIRNILFKRCTHLFKKWTLCPFQHAMKHHVQPRGYRVDYRVDNPDQLTHREYSQ